MRFQVVSKRGDAIEPKQGRRALDGVDQPKGFVESGGIRGVAFQLQERLDKAVELLLGFVEIEADVIAHLVSRQVTWKGMVAHGSDFSVAFEAMPQRRQNARKVFGKGRSISSRGRRAGRRCHLLVRRLGRRLVLTPESGFRRPAFSTLCRSR